MATIGSSTTGFTFTVSGSWNQFAGGSYTVPDPGIYPTALEWHGHNSSGSTTARNYLWLDNGSNEPGTTVYSGSAGYTLTTTDQWWSQSSIAYRNNATGFADGYIPGGTKVWIGAWVSSAAYVVDGTSTGTSTLGTGGDGNYVFHDYTAGFGVMASILTFNYATPHITSYNVSQGAPGDTVVITGYAFNGATGVAFNGVSASYTVNSNTQITATVPSGATTGTITVTNAYGTGTGPSFTILNGYVWNGSAWVGIPINVWNGTSAVYCPIYVYNGSAWVQVG